MWKKQITNLMLGFALLTGCASPTPTVATGPLLQTKIPNTNLKANDASSVVASTFGGMKYERAKSLIVLPEDGYILAGSTNLSFGNSVDLALVKLNASGNAEWFRIYGGRCDDYMRGAVNSKDGGYLLMGKTNSLFITPLPGCYPFGAKTLLVKVDKHGVTKWAQEFPDLLTLSLIQSQNGDYMLAGGTDIRRKKSDLALIKIDQTGETVWQMRYNSQSNDSFQGLRSLVELQDGGFFLLGTASESEKSYFIGAPLLIRVSAEGEIQWSRRLDGIIGMMSRIIALQDGYAILGSIGDNEEMLVINVNSEGDVLWAKSYKGHDKKLTPYSTLEDSNGMLVIGGATDKAEDNGIVMGLQDDGEIDFCLEVVDVGIFSVKENANGQLLVAGDTRIGPGLNDMFFSPVQRNEGGLWKNCKDKIKTTPVELQTQKFEILGEKGDFKVNHLPTGNYLTGVRETEFPIE